MPNALFCMARITSAGYAAKTYKDAVASFLVRAAAVAMLRGDAEPYMTL